MNKDEFWKAVDDVIEDCLRNDSVFGDYAHKVTDAVWPVLEAAEKERDELRARIERMERQEPVAWTTQLALELGSSAVGFDACRGNLWGDKGVPLYALPGAKGEEK